VRRYWDFKPRQFIVYGDTTKDNLPMGYELEADEGNLRSFLQEFDVRDDYEKLYYFKSDGSLGSDGLEMVTHPCTLDYHRNEFPLAMLIDLLKDHSYVSYDNADCGFHVHVPRSALTQSEAVKVGLLIYRFENKFSAIAQRDCEEYAKFKHFKASKHSTDDYDRYSAVNYSNSNTIEFRIFKGTLARKSIMAYLCTVHSAVNFIRCHNTHEVSRKDAFEKYVKYIYSHHMRYPELIRYLERKKLSGSLHGKYKKISDNKDTASYDNER
jgi:hypothetical protein